MKEFWRNNSLSIVLFAAFFLCLLGQITSGLAVYNEERQEHNQAAVTVPQYLPSGHFGEAVFENWESEFLQMAAYVLLTVFLFQKGSAESKDPDHPKKDDQTKEDTSQNPNAPWPVRKGGFILTLYKNSLFIAFAVLFIVSLALHAVTGAQETCRESSVHQQSCESIIEYATGSQFWFESFQNWQSEFLAVGSIVVLSIFLRQQGSPESKSVTASHATTG